jgi:hypothetical protein
MLIKLRRLNHKTMLIKLRGLNRRTILIKVRKLKIIRIKVRASTTGPPSLR